MCDAHVRIGCLHQWQCVGIGSGRFRFFFAMRSPLVGKAVAGRAMASFECGDLLKYNKLWSMGMHASHEFALVVKKTPKGHFTVVEVPNETRLVDANQYGSVRRNFPLCERRSIRKRRLKHPELWKIVTAEEKACGVLEESVER